MAATIKLAVDERGWCSGKCDLIRIDMKGNYAGCRKHLDDALRDKREWILCKPSPACPLHDAPPGTTVEKELCDVGTAHRVKVLELAWKLFKSDIEDGTVASLDVINFDYEHYIAQAEAQLAQQEQGEKDDRPARL